MEHPLIVAIHFVGSQAMDYPFNSKYYFESYRMYAELCAQHDLEIRFIRGEHLHFPGLIFDHSWKFVDGELTECFDTFKANLLYPKLDGFVPQAGPGDIVLNNRELDLICMDKRENRRVAGEFMAMGTEINAENWQEVISSIPTDKVVLKPVFGYGGHGIIILPKAEFTQTTLDWSEPYLAEAFVDTSTGIPGLVDGIHDLRILMFNGEPTLAYIRQPKQGDLLANLEQGGSVFTTLIDKVPAEVIREARAVDSKLSKYWPRFYSIDFMVENGKPYVCELNSRPGLPHPERQGVEFTTVYHTKLLELMLTAMGKS